MLEQVYLVCEWPNTHDGTMRAILGLTMVEHREEKKEGESAIGSERAWRRRQVGRHEDKEYSGKAGAYEHIRAHRVLINQSPLFVRNIITAEMTAQYFALIIIKKKRHAYREIEIYISRFTCTFYHLSLFIIELQHVFESHRRASYVRFMTESSLMYLLLLTGIYYHTWSIIRDFFQKV